MQTPDKDRLDLWLDKALRQHGDAEPRAGLESRVLASVSARRRERAGMGRAWILGGVAVVAIAAVVLFKPSARPPLNPPNNGGLAKITPPSLVLPATRAPVFHAAERSAPKLRHASPLHALNASAESPRRVHFPSARPLAPQELALARYAVSYPAEAALIAKEQENFEDEVQKAEQEAEAGSVPENQNQ